MLVETLKQINWFFLSSGLLVLTTLFIIFILAKFGTNKVHRLWLLLNISIFLWACAATIISQAHLLNDEFVVFSWKIGVGLGVTFIAVLILHLVSELVNLKHKIIIILTYFQGVFFAFLVLFTNLIIGTKLIYHYDFYYIPNISNLWYFWFFLWLLIIGYAHFHLTKYVICNHRLNFIPFLIGMAFGCINGAMNFIFSAGILRYDIANFGVVLYCLIVTYAIFRHQLFGIEVIYRKGLLYSLLIATFSAIYFILILGIEWFFRQFIGYKSFFVSLIAAFTIALLFNPLRNKIQALIDHLFLGKTPEEIARENELLRQEVERSERLKAASTLALGLAHEIKNPLTTIKTFSEHLPEKCHDKEFVSKFSSLIPSEVERINSIVHRLLDFSKPSPPSFHETNIHSLIKDILEFLSNDFLKHRITLHESYEDTNLTLRLDPSQIKQVVLNLLINALEAMPQGGNLYIRTQKTPQGAFELSIKDEGCGIPPEHMKKLFTPFFSTKEGGSGLGLSICHQITKNHGGTIEVESERNAGTEIRIRFPSRKDQG